MATSTPVTKVYIAWDSGYTTADASRTWTEVTSYVEGDSAITITRGRQDELGDVEPSKLSITLDNSEGRFTPNKTSGAYYPNVRKGRPIRVTVTYNSLTYNRFTGYIDEWPLEWPDEGDSLCTVTLTATSRLARMAKGVELRPLLEEELMMAAPLAYWPLTEADTGVFGQTAASIAGNAPALVKTKAGSGVSDDLLFASQAGPPTMGTGQTAPGWAPLDSSNGAYLSTPIAWTGTVLSVSVWFVAPAGSSSQNIVTLSSADTTQYIEMWITAAGGINVKLADGGLTTTDLVYGSGYDDGALHHVVFDVTSGTGGAANGTGHLYLDGALVTTVTDVITFYLGLFTYLNVGGNRLGLSLFGTNATAGMISHVAFYSSVLGSTNTLLHYYAGATGFLGEYTGSRVNRFAGYAAIPQAELFLDTGTTQCIMQETDGKTPLELMRDLEETESGLLFDGKDGGLYFYARSRRYTTTAPYFTLDCSLEDVGSDLSPTFDDQYIKNDVTVSRAESPTGPPVETWRATDASSLADYGPYRESVDSLAYLSGEVTDAAAWRIAKYAQPIVRIPTVTADLVNADTTLGDKLIGCSVNDRFRLTNLPSQAPASTLDVFIEGYQETITSSSYVIAFYVTPASLSEVWVVEDATYGVYDTYPLGY